MNNVLKTILIILIAIFGAGVLFIPSTQAQTNLVDILFENTPLFNEANFLPGDSITRWAKVTNVSGETQRIATEAINYTKPIPADDLSRALMLVIKKQGGTDLYGGSSPTGPKSLYNFYQDSEAYLEIYLSDLGNGETVQYDFTISFPSEKENEWQEKTTHFDVLIGSQGTTSPPPPSPPTPPGGGGGGGLPPGLTIFNEADWNVTEISVTITWQTNYFSTSQVIYATGGEAHTLDLSDNTGTPPKYGYANTILEYDTSPKVTFHSVTITGLTPETTYYYRCVSHASLAISQSHTFTTLGTAEGEEEEEEQVPTEGETEEVEEEIPGEVAGEETEIITEEEAEETEEVEGELEEEAVAEEEEEEAKMDLGKFLAAVGNFFNLENLCWLLILALAVSIALFYLTKKGIKKEDENIWWILILVVVISIIVALSMKYCWILLIPIILIIVLLILDRIKEEKKKKEGASF